MAEGMLTEGASLRFEQVSKHYGGSGGVLGVDLELPQHEIIGLIGPNGGGKSTLLKLADGLLRPDGGTVFACGRAVRGRAPEGVVLLPDGDALYPFLTVEEMSAHAARVLPDYDVARAARLIQFLELQPRVRISALSKGGRARMKLVLTLSRDAPLILMDEPLSGLDPLVRASVLEGLISFVDLSRQTVVLATHEVAEVEPIVDRAVLVHDGGIRAVDTVEHIEAQGRPKGLVDWMAASLNTAEVHL